MSTHKILSEDWTATIIGLAVIALSIIAYLLFDITLPSVNYKWSDSSSLADIFSLANLASAGLLLVVSGVVASVLLRLRGRSWTGTLGFVALFAIAFVASVIGGNSVINNLGLEAVIFSLLIGLFIRNFIGLPSWLSEGLASELYIKLGLVFLGATILFGDILKSGVYGLLQAVIVVFCVWHFAYWLFQRLKLDKELSLMMASGVSICGVAAAVASAGAIKGDPKKLSFVVSLILVVALPMIVIMPLLAHLLGLNDTIAGAWIGGTIDTTGAVVATGSLFGDEALKTASIVKFSQNVLLGIAAFAIAVYWSVSGEHKDGDEKAEKPTLATIWERFPKFVLGFVGASVIFSLFFAGPEYKSLIGGIKTLQSLFFSLGFVSIGLETDFKTFALAENKKATFAFIGAQTFNVIFTLVVALVLFGLLQ